MGAPFLAPWAAGMVLFFVYPLLATVYFSFTNYDGLNTADFVGLRNYVFMFTSDPLVKAAAYNTLWLVVVLTVGRLVFAMGVAQILTKSLPASCGRCATCRRWRRRWPPR